MSDIIERARALRVTIEGLAQANLDDKAALDNKELFPIWSGDGIHYEKDQRVRYNSILYRVLQAHDSQASWTPDEAHSLFDKVLISDPSVIPEWEQPGSTNGYHTGDKVRHNGHIWQSLVDNNVWEPGTVGTESLWQQVEE